MMVAVIGTLFTLSCIMVSVGRYINLIVLKNFQIGVAYLLGARFDIAMEDLKGKISGPAAGVAQSMKQKFDHREL